MALRLASARVSPSRKPELILIPSPPYASPTHPAGRLTVSMIGRPCCLAKSQSRWSSPGTAMMRSEEHTSELQSRLHLVCRLLLEKKKNNKTSHEETKRSTRANVT